MALKITKKTKLPKSFKLPRRKKKPFKKAWIGTISSVTVKPDSTTSNLKDIMKGWARGIYNYHHMKRYNLKQYKGTKQIFMEE